MMMRMLNAGGLEIVTDEERTADEDNPRGYFELEAVKRTNADDSWIEKSNGKVVKVISELLKPLPTGHQYKVIFMRRKLDEVLASQQKMLDRRGETNDITDDKMKELFAGHVEEVEALLRDRDDMETLFVSYNRVLAEPQKHAERINQFLDGRLNVEAMVEAVEPGLYRNRA